MLTAFVASTLPALFLSRNLDKLNINRLIVSRQDLFQSFLFLKEKFPDLEIIILPKKNQRHFLRSEIASSNKGIVIFHECGWLDLDLLLLDIQPKVYYFPQVTLKSYTQLEFEDLTAFKLLIFICKNLSRSSIKFAYQVLRLKDLFFYYSTPADGTRRLGFEYSLNHKNLKHLETSHLPTSFSDENPMQTTLEQKSKNIIFLLGTDVFEREKIELLFKQLFKLVQEKGYRVVLKDHPNPAFRLNLECNDAIKLEPSTPFEVIEMDYWLKIGLGSSALAYEADKSICIFYLLGDQEDDIISNRVNHLKYLPRGDKIKYAKSLSSIDELL